MFKEDKISFRESKENTPVKSSNGSEIQVVLKMLSEERAEKKAL